jgi:iron only hydrogenase large subunit-like protein
MVSTTGEILRTLTAKCRDCYRCIRQCPVKAIGVRNNQAYIDPERCILCGTCVKECPQYAKVYRDDTEAAAELLQAGPVAASVAPSFSAVYGGWKAKNLPAALRKLGFAWVAETAEGALLVAERTGRLFSEPGQSAGICSACPVVVNYVEKYRPQHTGKLFPVVSPMIAHARLLKKHYGPDLKVVFIGPCIAKKYEAQRPEYRGDVDVALTFRELDRWLERENIQLENCVESGFDNRIQAGHAKLFALPGGMLKTMAMPNDTTRKEVMQTSGMQNVKMLFDSPDALGDLEIIEPLFCNEGCINGPGIENQDSLFSRRTNLIAYTSAQSALPAGKEKPPELDLDLVFHPAVNLEAEFSEEQILEVFAQTDKADPEARLNCGACGYDSCEDNAKAVLRRMAEIQTCVPYMRKLAEQRTDKIIETSPNGIVILDESLHILSMNSSFCKYFTCSNSTIGKKISQLFNARDYEKLATGKAEYMEAVITYDDKEFHQIAYRLPAEKQYVGIYTDVSGIRMTEAKMDRIKKQTVEKAQELLDHQIKMAQTIAKYLGESTAQSEELVERLMSIYDKTTDERE